MARTATSAPRRSPKTAANREHLSDGSGLGLITIRLTDLGRVGAYTPAVDPEHARPDVVCDLRPSEARQLAAALLDLADRSDPPLTES